MECIFCKIVSGEIPAERVYEDNDVLAFLDIHPFNPGHSLIIPKIHFENIYNLSDATLIAITSAAKKIASAIKQATRASGINLLMNNEPAAGQLVLHAHVHVFPRFLNDGYPSRGPYIYKDPRESTALAEKIRNAVHS